MLKDSIFWLGIIGSAIGMEYWARYAHKEIWHKNLWFIHGSHHGEGKKFKGLELNDLFGLSHGIVAMELIFGGLRTNSAMMVGTGIGMTIYGGMYFIVHDGMIHGRIPVEFLMKFDIMKKIKEAHDKHHESGGLPYGLFLGMKE